MDRAGNQSAIVTSEYIIALDTVNMISGPEGSPNPVESEGSVTCSVMATDSLGHTLSYQWSATGGSFDNATTQNPVWHAPANASDTIQYYDISVTATCSEGQSATGSYTQGVFPVAIDDADGDAVEQDRGDIARLSIFRGVQGGAKLLFAKSVAVFALDVKQVFNEGSSFFDGGRIAHDLNFVASKNNASVEPIFDFANTFVVTAAKVEYLLGAHSNNLLSNFAQSKSIFCLSVTKIIKNKGSDL